MVWQQPELDLAPAVPSEHAPAPAIPPGSDFVLVNDGTVVLLTPISDAANAWCEEHIDPDAQRWAGAYVIEPATSTAT